MQFQEGAALYSYEVQRKGGEDILYINYLGAPFVPSLSEQPSIMEHTINLLIENPNVSRIVFVQQKNYSYDFKETSMLLEIAQLYVYLSKQERILSIHKLVINCQQFFTQRYNEIFSFLVLLKQDPVVAYADLKKLVFEARIFLNKVEERCKADQANYLSVLEKLLSMVEETKIIQEASQHFTNYHRGERGIYHYIFKPDIVPNFTFTRLVSRMPEDAEIIDQYKISGEGA